VSAKCGSETSKTEKKAEKKAKKTEGKCGTRATAINAYTYLTWVLSYPRMDLADKDYVFKCIKWINLNGTHNII